MVMCFVATCNHYTERGTCRFFRIPKNEALRRQWVALIGREDRQPSQYSMVCSCHFENGKKDNLPTLFVQSSDVLKSKKPIMKPRSPQKKKQRKSDSPEKATGEPVPGSSYRKELFPTTSTSATPDEVSTSEEQERVESRCSSGLQREFQQLSLSGSAAQQAEMYFLEKENAELKAKLERLSLTLSFNHIEGNNKLIKIYTGLPNQYLYECLYSLFEHRQLKYTKFIVGKIPKKDQLLLTLMKLRMNLLHEDLAFRFNCSATTVGIVVTTWIHALHEILFCQLMREIPSRHKNRLCLPGCFSALSNCRIVLDCTEVNYIKPTALDTQKLTYSSYKKHNTVKGLIGVAPNGVVTFVSHLYPGSTSDRKIVEDSGVLKQMQPGDLVVADKGFLIKDLLPAGVSLNLPPFLTTSQFTKEQVLETRTIARARIHVERAIQRIKRFHILSAIPRHLAPQATMIFQVVAAITNFQFPLIAEVEDLYRGDESD